MAGLCIGTVAGRRGAQLVKALRGRGATVIWGPTVQADIPEPADALLAATDAILSAEPRFVAVSTAVGIRRWVAVADDHGRGAALRALLARSAIAARGPKAVSGLLAVGLRPSFVSPRRMDADVARWLTARVADGDAVAVQLHGSSTVAPFAGIAEAGADVLPVTPYRNELPTDPEPPTRLIAAAIVGTLNVLVATNATTVDNLFVLAERAGAREALVRALNQRVAAVAIGTVTAAAFERSGTPVAAMPREPHTGELLRSLESWMQRRVDDGVTSVRARALRLEPDVGVVRVGDRGIVLSPLEFAVLAALVRRPGVVCPLETLSREVWGHARPRGPGQIKHHVARIRRKLGPDGAAIENVRAVGYRYNPAVVPVA